MRSKQRKQPHPRDDAIPAEASNTEFDSSSIVSSSDSDTEDDLELDEIKTLKSYSKSNIIACSSAIDIVQAPLSEMSFELRADQPNEFITALSEGGYIGLGKAIIEQQRLTENMRANALKGVDETLLLDLFVDILARTHTKILKGIMRGTLCKDYFKDADTRYCLDLLREVCVNNYPRPAIYCNVVASVDAGEFLTPTELETVLSLMERYVAAPSEENDAIAGEIDDRVGHDRHQHRKGLDSTYRRYLSRSNGTGPVDRRQFQITKFVNSSRARIRRTNGPPDEPMEAAAFEEGYSINPLARLTSHREHENSNYILNLFEACTYVEFGDKFRLHQFVIYLIDRLEQTSSAELMFHLIAYGYVDDGAGFAHHPAGTSSYRAFETLSGHHWASFAAWTEDNSPLLANIALFRSHTDKLITENGEKTMTFDDIVDSVYEGLGDLMLEEEAWVESQGDQGFN